MRIRHVMLALVLVFGAAVTAFAADVSGTWTAPLVFLIAGLTIQLAAGYLVSRPGSIELQKGERVHAA